MAARITKDAALVRERSGARDRDDLRRDVVDLVGLRDCGPVVGPGENVVGPRRSPPGPVPRRHAAAPGFQENLPPLCCEGAFEAWRIRDGWWCAFAKCTPPGGGPAAVAP